MPSAYLLVSHGSRDPRPQVAMDQLARLVSKSQGWVEASGWVQAARDTSSGNTFKRLAAPPMCEPLVGTACLELSPVPLHEQIKEFGARAVAVGCNRLQVVPLFLLPGVHVMEDIPTEVAIAQQTLGQDITIDLRPHLGTHPNLSDLLTTQVTASAADAWIVLAHGSRRAGSRQPVEAIATRLERQAAGQRAASRTGVAVSAYWAVPPRLESRMKELVGAGYRQIGILPYFLFAGGITDAIALEVEQLKEQFPSVNLLLAEPLGASAQLADLIWDLIET